MQLIPRMDTSESSRLAAAAGIAIAGEGYMRFFQAVAIAEAEQARILAIPSRVSTSTASAYYRIWQAVKQHGSIDLGSGSSARLARAAFSYVLEKVRFRGLQKNTAQLLTLFALSNLWMARKQLMTSMGVVRPRTA